MILKGAVYHVTARTNRRELDLDSDKEKREFLKVLNKVKSKYPFVLYAFNIMGNHIHLLIKPCGDSSISRIMQLLLSLFARGWNKRHNTCGHFWGDRFHSIIIENEEHFRNAIRYIEENAVRIGLVDTVAKWIYSSWAEHFRDFGGLIQRNPIFEYG